MTDEDISNDSGFDRRKFLAGLGAGAAAGIAGCTGDGGGDSGTDTTTAPTDTTTDGGGDTTTTDDGDTTTTTAAGPQPGGKPIIGLAVPPATLNPLQAGSVYSFYIIDRVMGYGTTTNPASDNPPEFAPWQIEDWTLNRDNAGNPQQGPALENVTLRDDITFTDGEDVTAEDLQFSMLYYREKNPSESLTGAAHQVIASGDNIPGEDTSAQSLGTGVEIVDEHTVNVYMASPEQRWLTNILGFPILPRHIWENVDDFTQYSPRQSEEGLVGSGAFELADFNWENWYELTTRDDYNIPAADYVPWIHDDAPFIDGIRFEVFGSQNAMEQAVLNGDIHAGFIAGGFTVNTAVQAENNENLTVHQASEVGYNHISYNLRRVPFDDPAFRQYLNKVFDKTWVVENPYSNIGAVAGDYVVIPALGAWRPPKPGELAGSGYKADGVDDLFDSPRDQIQMPDLSFPGNAGTFNLANQEQVQAARDFLINNPRAKHDYSWGEAQTSITRAPDNKELYVNGTHINQAHTDNDGNTGQGPIVFSFQPPQEDIYQARYGNQMVGMMKLLGIPTEPLVKTINAQIPTVYSQEDFDMFAMGWGLGVSVTHLAALYSSQGADVDSTQSTGAFNPMGYTAADDLIFRDLELMDFERRFPVVKQICAKIYADAPTQITDVSQLLEPTRNEFTGWMGGLGTTINEDSFLNIRQSQ